MRNPGYTVITGGVGGAKLVLGLQHVLGPEQLQAVVNTGDDFRHLGLTICPDIDTLLYTLSNRANPVTGWGVRDDTWNCLTALAELGGPDWFRLGDRDLGLHLLRRQLLDGGLSLSAVTDRLRRAMGIATAVWPMADEPAPTTVHTDAGTLEFQDYFVRRRAEPVARGFDYGVAAPAPQALAALQNPALQAIFIAPSNPWLSVEPVLSLPGVRATIRAAGVPVVAVAPVIAGRAIKGPTAKLMAELELEPGVTGIARHYAGLIDGLIIDRRDAEHQHSIEALGIVAGITDTLMSGLEDKKRLAAWAIDFAHSLAGRGRA